MGTICDTFYSPLPTSSNRDVERGSTKSSCSSNFDTSAYNQFFNHVISNRYQKIALTDRTEILNHIDSSYKKPILLLACEGENSFANVTAKTIQHLIEQGADIDYIDHHWYGWGALHYAARAADAVKLTVICTKLAQLDGDKINSLTTLSENALHVLLDHGTFSESLDVSCQNGTDFKMSKIIHPERECIVDCVRVLLNAGIDVNHNNFWNETPIMIAIKRKYFQVVQLLLENAVDLDSCTDVVSGKTARELLKGKEAYFKLLLQHRSNQDPKKVLFQFLKSGDEESFLKYNGGKIKEYVDVTDGSNTNNSSCSLLQYCFRRGLIAWYQEKRKYDCASQFHYSDITANHLVQVFCQNGMAKSVEHLLDNGAQIDLTLGRFNVPLLEVAVMKGYYPLVAMILGRDDVKFSPQKICDIITKLMEKSNSDIDLDNTLSILLNRLLTSEQAVQLEDVDKLMRVLSSSVRIIDKENIHLFLKFPGSLCTESHITKKTILEEIDPEVVRNHLDECVERKDDDIYINYDSFIKHNSSKQVLQHFLHSPVLNIFLNHLVFKILINRMWERLHTRIMNFNTKYFYVNFYFYIIFFVLLNIFVLLRFNDISGTLTNIVRVLGIICLVIFIVKELVQIVANARLYIKEFNNYAEIFLIIFATMVYIIQTDFTMVMSVLSSDLVLLLLLEQVPIFAKYIIILRTVVFYLKYIVFYFIQFLAFAICFYILFSKSDQKFLNDLPNKIFETVILFTGNLDYMDTNKFEKDELFSKMVFIIFVLFMAIILHNLLLGLLVTDMSDLNNSVKLFEQMKRAGFVVRGENFLTSSVIRRFFPYLVLYYDNQKSNIFDKGNKYLIVNETDRKMLGESEKQYLDFILVKKEKRQNVLKKLYSYIKSKINESYCERIPHEVNKEVLDKLKLIEERIKNLHELMRL